MWIGFPRLLIMTAHVRDIPGKGRTLRTMRGSRAHDGSVAGRASDLELSSPTPNAHLVHFEIDEERL